MPDSLLELQRNFHSFLRSRLGPGAEAPLPREVLAQFQAPPRDIDVGLRLRVYADAYASRLTESLADDFEAVSQTVGPGMFRILAHEYLARVPPASPLLIEMGEAFPRFLGAHSCLSEWPHLAALAQLEWWVVEAGYADPLVVETKSIASPGLDWAATRLRLCPSLRLYATPWALCDVWNRRAEGRLRVPSARAEKLLIHRGARGVRVEPLSEIEFIFLSEARGGRTLAEISDELCQKTEGVEDCDLAGSLASWVRKGIIYF